MVFLGLSLAIGLFGLSEDNVLPPASDLFLFETGTSPVILEFHYRECQAHRARLVRLRNIQGWSGGYWDDMIDQTDQQALYWLIMCRAHSCYATPADVREQLGRLKRLIGPEAYLAGYVPPVIPDHSKFQEP